MMWEVVGTRPVFGKIKHVIRAIDRAAAEARFLRAHPNGAVLFSKKLRHG